MEEFVMKDHKAAHLIAGFMCVVLICLASSSVSMAGSNISDKVKKIYLSKEMSVRGATLWPVVDTQLYDKNGKVSGTITAGEPAMALSASDDYIKIYYKKNIAYIESKYAMINLPDVMPEEMLFDITNAYSSIYRINGEDISDVTDEVLYPYAMIDDETFLVPLLYPVAKQLYKAEKDAIDKGYTLKVYDAYRPYTVTKYIYETTSEFIAEFPELEQYINGSVNGVKYSQSYFLAKTASNHNYGVAVDITICDLDTKEELEMQSPMHELSVQSVLAYNTDGANLLQKIMTENGFGTLVSEWWHFEIRDYKEGLAAFQAKPYKK